MLNRKVNYLFLVFLLIIVKIFGIYLPEIIEEKSYDTIKMPTKLVKEYQQQQQQDHQPHGYYHPQEQQQQQFMLQHQDHNINHLSEVIDAIRSQKQQVYLIKQQQQQQLEQTQQEARYSQQQQEYEHDQQQGQHQQQQQKQPEEEIVLEKSYDHINSIIHPNNDASTTITITLNPSNARIPKLNSTTTASVATASVATVTTANSIPLNDKEILKSNVASSKYRHKRHLSDLFIVPHTKWCGKGNLANGTYNYLGGASLADKCCRRHDNCSLFIPAFSKRYDMFNYLPYTLSHCSCDRRFHTCLKMANDDDARTVGKLFFNMIQTNCFIIRREKVCMKRATDNTCELETYKQKAYQRSNKKF